MSRKLPSIFYNLITFIGVAIAALSFGLILFLTVLDLLEPTQKPYMGVITFVVLPGVLCIGLFLIVSGAWWQHRREVAGTAHLIHYPRIDLNDPKHLFAFTIFAVGTLVFLAFTGFGSFKAYEYTDSDSFCGTMCHTLMIPEYTAYHNSPHARVGCVKCHIGPGAGWFVKSKLSGAYQVYATLLNKYPKPIPTPIANLRPAQDTCEQCHWPQHFYSEKHITNTYFKSDEKNTKWTIHLLLKTGGGNPEVGITKGIHWSMNIANQISYITTDERRQTIPWVRSISRDGKEAIYFDTESKQTKEALSKLTPRKMDCIDCHNRPSHRYLNAQQTVDHAMSLGWIPADLPNIKSFSVKALESEYSATPVALQGIEKSIKDAYSSRPESFQKEQGGAIQRTILELQKIYQRNYFPEMKVTWKQFPHNIGHMYAPGCFRCHDGKHKSEDGKTLTKDCNVCHTILSQQYENSDRQVSIDGIEYKHPEDIGDAWKETNCSECHTNN